MTADAVYFLKSRENYLLVKKEAGILLLPYAVSRFNRTSQFSPQGYLAFYILGASFSFGLNAKEVHGWHCQSNKLDKNNCCNFLEDALMQRTLNKKAINA